TEAVDVSAARARSRRLSTRPLIPNRVQFVLSPPPNAGFMSLVAVYPFQIAVSPNGKHLAFTAAVGNTQSSSIWIRPMDALDARRLEGTEFALYPFWSPDSRSIAFFAGGKLKKIDIDGGTAQVVCDAPVSMGEGGTWSKDGTIVFARPGSALHRVSE